MSTITLPWPPKALTPHAKGHWRPKAAATKTYRATACVLTKAARLDCNPNARLVFRFHPPNRARRDLHNLPIQMKAAIDGIADAMGCDDHGFRCAWPETFDEPIKGGAVIVTVEAAL